MLFLDIVRPLYTRCHIIILYSLRYVCMYVYSEGMTCLLTRDLT